MAVRDLLALAVTYTTLPYQWRLGFLRSSTGVDPMQQSETPVQLGSVHTPDSGYLVTCLSPYCRLAGSSTCTTTGES